jgi:hypothetical protein
VPIDQARALIASLRRNGKCLGFSRAEIAEVQRAATPQELDQAKELFGAALEGDLFMPFHNNAFAALGPITLNLVMDSERAEALAGKVMENDQGLGAAHWHFGETTAVCDVIAYLWENETVEDRVFVPLLVWLHRQSRREWERMGSISEAALGNAGHNWWMHSYFGFWFMGTFFDCLQGAGRFQHLVPEYFEVELENLFGPEGWSIEESPNYHLFAARYAIKIDELCRKNGIELGEKSRALLRGIAKSFSRLLAPDLQYPGFCDSVVGRYYPGFSEYLRLDYDNRIYFKRVAALYGLGELKSIVEQLTGDLERSSSVWSRLGDLQEAYDTLPKVRPESVDTAIPGRGLYAMRESWEPNSNYLAIQAGLGGTAEKSHKQSDIFNFELYSHGERVIVDNWYGPAAEMSADRNPRMWRISTDAHNTVGVDGQDQLQILHEFRYGNVVQPLVQGWESTPEHAYFHGVHDAYRHLVPDAVPTHRRKIFFLKNHLWIMIDRLIPATDSAHDYSLNFHLKPRAQVLSGKRVITCGEGGNVLLIPWCNQDLALDIRDNPYPLDGYENPQQVRCTTTCQGPVIFVTLMVPFCGGTAPEVSVNHLEVTADDRVLRRDEATALHITAGKTTLDYVDLHTHWILPWEAGNMHGTARRAHRIGKA